MKCPYLVFLVLCLYYPFMGKIKTAFFVVLIHCNHIMIMSMTGSSLRLENHLYQNGQIQNNDLRFNMRHLRNLCDPRRLT